MRKSVILCLSGCAVRKKQECGRAVFLQVTREADGSSFKETSVLIFCAAFLLSSLRSGVFLRAHTGIHTPQYACFHEFRAGLCDDAEVHEPPSVVISDCQGRGALSVG